jgi:hypothetical protein
MFFPLKEVAWSFKEADPTITVEAVQNNVYVGVCTGTTTVTRFTYF